MRSRSPSSDPATTETMTISTLEVFSAPLMPMSITHSASPALIVLRKRSGMPPRSSVPIRPPTTTAAKFTHTPSIRPLPSFVRKNHAIKRFAAAKSFCAAAFFGR